MEIDVMEIKLINKSYIFLNIIIITMILFFAGHLSAQRIGHSNSANKREFHRSYKHHRNTSNRSSLKANVKAKNKFQYRNKVQEHHNNRHDNKDSAGPTWLKNPDTFPGVLSDPPPILLFHYLHIYRIGGKVPSRWRTQGIGEAHGPPVQILKYPTRLETGFGPTHAVQST